MRSSASLGFIFNYELRIMNFSFHETFRRLLFLIYYEILRMSSGKIVIFGKISHGRNYFGIFYHLVLSLGQSTFFFFLGVAI